MTLVGWVFQGIRGNSVLLGISLLVSLLFIQPRALHAAVGCQLNDPEGDLRRFFPGMTDFAIGYVSFEAQDPDGQVLLGKRLKDKLDKVYETIDVPYSMYTVRKEGRVVGHVFGANQRGTYSNIQVIAVTDESFRLKRVYLQKLRSPVHQKFQDKIFLDALAKIPFETFPEFSECYRNGLCDDVPVQDPTGGAESGDFRSILRAMAKLYHLHTILLHPSAGVVPRDLDALAGRIQNYWRPDYRLKQQGALRKVTFVDPFEARSFLGGLDRVVVWNTESRARVVPVTLLDRHPVIEFEYGLGKQVIVWSANSQSATIHSRVIGAREYHFSPSGNILLNTITLVDDRMETEWSSVLGLCLYGVAKGAEMPPLPGVSVMTWGQATRFFQDIVVVVPKDPKEKFEHLTDTLRRWYYDGRIREFDWVVRAEETHVFPRGTTPRGVVYQGEGLLVINQSRTLFAFDTSKLGARVRFRTSSAGPAFVEDVRTRSRWNAVSGVCVRGKHKGKKLTPAVVLHLPSEATRAFFPKAKRHRR
jgi:hypothetical protein